MSEKNGGPGSSGEQKSAGNPDKALEAFPTHNVYSACAACECAFPIVLSYDDEEQTPVPDAGFTVKWGAWVPDDSQAEAFPLAAIDAESRQQSDSGGPG